MVDLEQKLKEYYEYENLEVSEDFIRRLKALESDPRAAKKPRRRYLLPVAAAIAAAVSLGSGWAYLRASRPVDPVVTDPDLASAVASPTVEASNPEPSKPAAPAKPAEKPAAEPEAAASEVSPAPSSPTQAEPAANPATGVPAAARQDDPAPAKPNDPTPENPGDPTPVPPDDPTPVKPDDPPVLPPDDPPVTPPVDDPPVVPPVDDPPVDPPDDPPVVPPVDDPPVIPPDDPPVEPPEDHGIDASYRTKGDRETLTLMSVSTGEFVELDVTGWQEELDPPPSDDPPPEETPAEAASAFVGRSSIVDFIFEKNIVFYLILDDDGTVLVKLDVTEN